MNRSLLWSSLILVTVLAGGAVSAVAREYGSWFWYGIVNFLAGFMCAFILRALDGGAE